MTRNLIEAALFFRAHAGYVVGERASGALKLARAELEASRRSWTVTWESDDYYDLGDHEYWCQEARRAKSESRRPKCRHAVEIAILRDSSGEILACLGGIIDADDEYRRVIDAELALEALAASCVRIPRPEAQA